MLALPPPRWITLSAAASRAVAKSLAGGLNFKFIPVGKINKFEYNILFSPLSFFDRLVWTGLP